MELGELLGLILQSFIVQICSTILSVSIFVIVYGVMIPVSEIKICLDEWDKQ